MMLEKRRTTMRPRDLALASAGLLGTQQKVEIDRTWPLEGIEIVVNARAGATGPTLTLDGILNIIKRINLSINDGVQPRSVWDTTGIGALEFAANEGLNLDAATLGAIVLNNAGSITANHYFRLSYFIPLVHPKFAEPLRTRCLLPVHTHPQNPVLTLDFSSGSEIYSAGSIQSLTCEVVLHRRQMPVAYNNEILQRGGFIPWDVIETPFTIGVGVSGEVRIPVATPGHYVDLAFRQYLGGSSVTRGVVDAVTTFGSETLWKLESGGATHRDWQWKSLKMENDRSRCLNSQLQASSPNVDGAVASATHFQPGASAMLDFASDGSGPIHELGSLLDCNLPANTGLKMEVVGNVASVATNGSTVYTIGRRLFGDLAPWKAIRV